MLGSFSLDDWKLWAYFIYFFVAVFLSCYIPGYLLIKKFTFDRLSGAVIATITGMVLWGLQGYIFGYLHLRWLSYVYLFVVIFVWLYKQRKTRALPQIKLKITKWEVGFVSLLILGAVSQLVQIWYSGVLVPAGMYFCCGIDSVYHLALTRELVQNFPPLDPGTVGSTVKNYHYFSNMVVAQWVKIFGLPLIATYFQYAPVLISFMLGLSAYAFARTVHFTRSMTGWLLFFLYFSGGGMYLLIYLVTHKIDISSIFLHDASLLWASPPRMYAIGVFFVGITLLSYWVHHKKLSAGILAAIVLASLISIKVYFGFVVLVGFGCLSIMFLIRRKYVDLIPFLILVLISAFLYIPINNQAGGLVFSGLWRLENFIVYTPLGLVQLENVRQQYALHHNFIRLVQFAVMYFILYMIGVFGTLLIGFFQTKKTIRFLPLPILIFLASGILTSIVCGLFFIQQVGGANSSQFIITALQIVPIFAAMTMGVLTEKMRFIPLKIFFIVIVIIFTIPRVAYDTVSKINENRMHASYILSHNELTALAYLNKLPPGVVLTPLQDCLYPRIFTNNFVFYCNDAAVLTDHTKSSNENIADRLNLRNYADLNPKVLEANNINYVYVRTKMKYPKAGALQLQTLYQNNEIIIKKVKLPNTQ